MTIYDVSYKRDFTMLHAPNLQITLLTHRSQAQGITYLDIGRTRQRPK